jgi:hypothetical protein
MDAMRTGLAEPTALEAFRKATTLWMKAALSASIASWLVVNLAPALAAVLGAREGCLAQVPPPTLPKLLVEMLLGLVLVVVAVVIAVEGWDHAVV